MKCYQFNTLLMHQDFAGASQLLQIALQQAEIINPKQDKTWAPPADHLGYAILEAQGLREYQKYCEKILSVFEEVLERDWGHIHRGHIYFHLGFAYLLALNFPRLENKKGQNTGLTTAMAIGIKILIDSALIHWRMALKN
ncbi:MAG: hypothetical protein JSV89_02140 [Spirochaetaceae bacterium]|nr:MAG: hypothetical protein JSV89_02140 [Spirochaetaceae bacterium]